MRNGGGIECDGREEGREGEGREERGGGGRRGEEGGERGKGAGKGLRVPPSDSHPEWSQKATGSRRGTSCLRVSLLSLLTLFLSLSCRLIFYPSRVLGRRRAQCWACFYSLPKGPL